MPKMRFFLPLLAVMLLLPSVALAAHGHPAFPKDLGLIWVVPFVCMLLSIAICPLAMPHFWHHHFGKVAIFWGLAFLVPATMVFGFDLVSFFAVETVVLEYCPFIILLLALFTTAGGIRLKGNLVGTPVVNTGLLAIGTVIASWIGTTGAAMLLIRPLLRANKHRKFQVHQVVFFIFLVANIGGSLTPLGDPPLFLGFLKGVSFFWTTSHLLSTTIFASVILLAVYFLLDTILFKKEGSPMPAIDTNAEKLGLDGKINIFFVACIVGLVLMSGSWKPGVTFDVYGSPLELQNLVRDLSLLVIVFLSMKLTSKECRELNDFNWEPILEVAKLFIGIFLSMIPALVILRAGTEGSLASLINMVTDPETGESLNYMYFWMTGLLSSFLDNAPTYLVFFNTAGGDAAHLMAAGAGTLAAISAGAVFMGAVTYIGNAPNFMVRSIAENSGVKMPSFFGYMAWSVGFLYPVFFLITYFFFM